MNALEKINHLILLATVAAAEDMQPEDIEAIAYLYKQREEQLREAKACIAE
jgi:hypothetical protein